VDATVVRLVFALLALAGGAGVVLYLELQEGGCQRVHTTEISSVSAVG